MPRFKKNLSNSRGFTLVELLTAIVLFAMLTTVLYSFLFMGIAMYKRVAAESQLRTKVNVFYSQFLNYINGTVYAYNSEKPNEIILIKKEKISAEQIQDVNYLRYYSLYLDVNQASLQYQPVTGSGLSERDAANLSSQVLDTKRYAIKPESTLAIEQRNEELFINLDWTFAVKNATEKDVQSPTIQIQSNLPVQTD